MELILDSRVLSMTANEKVLWKLGNLKLVRPNVCPYKLLLFNYLQMYHKVPSAQTNAQKNYQRPITSVRPNCHNTMLAVVVFRRQSLLLSNFVVRSRSVVLSFLIVMKYFVCQLWVFSACLLVGLSHKG
jgi:hypothetical protein